MFIPPSVFHPMLTSLETNKRISWLKRAVMILHLSLQLSPTLNIKLVKSEILRECKTPPNHHWYENKHPGSSFLLKCGRASQMESLD
ncbi:hypothetical protein TNIN_145151 [Trichonephila inaurata madagascariensis]|uniref:Uncharacterized protein n=1 Tax=Trichonephila inaurata madagascariensis TaxID=2747483 RepID=A0A8X6YDU0_9ARAC|nr:hypothetical protein TNIN_145151 [Trichonephila inaurata madagascariensis]